jgi:4-amino-4-deoxy-L-arabinose transferase-like glycosyltransferase
LVGVGLWLRLHGLAEEGFADDELHKWLAANRYLHGDFGGDDLEHPMLMKSLIALTLMFGQRFQWAPETITRFPNALAGGLSVLILGFLGKRLFGRFAGLLAAALGALSATFVGYQRIAKEDALLGVFLMLVCLCIAEAKAAADAGEDRRRRQFELAGAAWFAAMMASKYFFFLCFIPLAAVWYLQRTNTRLRVPLRRWLQLAGVAAVAWLCLNWMVALPSTWEYIGHYMAGAQHGGRATHMTLSFMGRLYPNLVQYGFWGMPPWFFAVFVAVKLTPGTFLLAVAGLIWAVRRRAPSQRIVLAWLGVWFLIHSTAGGKYGRTFLPVMPAFFLLAASASAWFLARARALSRELIHGRTWFGNAATLAVVTLVALVLGNEAWASLAHAPHYRTYISPLGGGERRVTWYFPHCDYYDAAFREALQQVALRAERGAEISSEIDWTAKYYAERFGRSDFKYSIIRPEQACRQGGYCYVLVQAGRWYEANREAIEYLSHRPPWQVVRIRNEEVVRVYRLLPGELPFRQDGPASASVPTTGRRWAR